MSLLRALLLIALGAPMLLACTAPSPAAGTTPTREPTARPSPNAGPPPPYDAGASGCLEYLGLLVSGGGQTVEAALTSYRCPGLYVDSTSRYPPTDPAIVIAPGDPLELRVDSATGEVPQEVELRLYRGVGVAGVFLRWPEDYLVGVQPVEGATPAPSPTVVYYPRAPPGQYSLVVRVAWDGPVDVFYAISFTIAPPNP